MTTSIDTRHVSAELKRRLTAEFPGVKFSVRRRKGALSLSVTWTDGPADADVNAIARPMMGSTWNGYDERYESTNNEVTVTIDGKRVTGRPLVNHINLHHEVSDDVRAEALALWKATNGADFDTQATNGGFTCEGVFIAGTWCVTQVLDIAQSVVLPRRLKAAEEAAAAAAPEPAVEAAPAPHATSGSGVDVTHTEEEGVVVRGTRRGDGSAPVLRDQGLKWHRREGYWYLPGTRGAAGTARVGAVRDALRTAGLLPAPLGESEETPVIRDAVSDNPAEAAVEEPRGLECGAHRVTNTGEGQPHGAGTAYVFRCLACDQRAPLVDFDSLKCTKEAEHSSARQLASRLLDNAILREADAYAFTYALAKNPVLRTRAEAVEDLARLIALGATHRWYAGEMRLMHHAYRVASVKPAPNPPAPQSAACPAPPAYRGVPVPERLGALQGDEVAAVAWRQGVDAALAVMRTASDAEGAVTGDASATIRVAGAVGDGRAQFPVAVGPDLAPDVDPDSESGSGRCPCCGCVDCMIG